MKRDQTRPPSRRGVTLLEVLTAVSLSATMMTSSFVVIRSSYAAWLAHEADMDRSANAAAVLRHFVQHARQGVGVSTITPAADQSGALTVVRADGSTLKWDHAGTGVTLSVNGDAAQPVADDIEALSFVGYEADGVTATTNPSAVQAVRVAATVQKPAGGARTVSTFMWVRSW